MTGALGIIAGSAASPGLYFSGDTNTGIYSPGADQVAISTNGTGRLFVDASGNVGVGTTSTAGFGRGVSVNGTTYSYYDLYADGVIYGRVRAFSNEMALLSQGASSYLTLGTNNTERMRLDSSGRLGLGTSSVAAKFHIAGYSSADQTPDVLIARSSSGTAIQAGPNITFSDGTTANTNTLQVTQGRFGIWNYGGGSWNERLCVTPGGAVGIGTTSPGAKLHVAAGANVGLQLDADTGLNTSIALSENGSIKWYFGNLGADDSFRFYDNTAATERLRIDSSGRLGLGTSSPQSSLDIANGTFQSVRTYLSSITDTYHLYRGTPDGSGFEHARVFSGRDTSVHTYGSYLAFYTEGKASGTTDTSVERLRIDSSGRVGIGTTTPASALHVVGTWSFIGNSATGSYSTWQYNGVSVGDIGTANQVMAGGANTDFGITTRGSTALTFGTATNERARIDSSGRLLVGTSTSRSNAFGASTFQLEDAGGLFSITQNANNAFGGAFVLAKTRGSSFQTVTSGDNLGILSWQGANGSALIEGARIQADVDGVVSGGGAGDLPTRLVFSTTADGASSPTERMRIKSNGDVLLGQAATSEPGFGNTTTGVGFRPDLGSLFLSRANEYGNLFLNTNAASGTTATAISFYRAGTTSVGSISTTATNTSYGTSSDYRLKENVVPLTGAIDRINELQVRRFNFIADPNKTVDGFIAHEAQAVVPECVTGEKDAVDAEGNPVYQNIDQSKLVPLLTAALQEAIGRIETLEAEVAALKAQ
jgi:hypothetical protein